MRRGVGHDGAAVDDVRRVARHVCDAIRAAFPEDVPLEIADFRFVSTGFGQRRKMAVERQATTWEACEELHEKLRKGGVSVNLGSEG